VQAAQRAAFERAIAEYRAVQMLNADRAESWLNLGSSTPASATAPPPSGVQARHRDRSALRATT
jgi:hypothetical protein